MKPEDDEDTGFTMEAILRERGYPEAYIESVRQRKQHGGGSKVDETK